MRLIITAILIYILYKLLFSEKKDQVRERKKKDENQVVGEMVQDPECKVYIPIDQAYERIIDGKKFYFCSKECADLYEEKRKGEKS